MLPPVICDNGFCEQGFYSGSIAHQIEKKNPPLNQQQQRERNTPKSRYKYKTPPEKGSFTFVFWHPSLTVYTIHTAAPRPRLCLPVPRAAVPGIDSPSLFLWFTAYCIPDSRVLLRDELPRVVPLSTLPDSVSALKKLSIPLYPVIFSINTDIMPKSGTNQLTPALNNLVGWAFQQTKRPFSLIRGGQTGVCLVSARGERGNCRLLLPPIVGSYPYRLQVHTHEHEVAEFSF